MDEPQRPSLFRALWNVLWSYRPPLSSRQLYRLRSLFPTPGNVLFTLLVVFGLLWASNAGAVPFLPQAANSTNTIAYQGRLANASGNPITAVTPMVFRLYNAATGGAPLWEENWVGANSVNVSDGLFNVMLGSLSAIPQSVVTGNSNLWLGITVNADSEMQPRVQLGTVPFAVQALTVPNGSITAAKLAPGLSLVPPDGSITTAKLADGAVTQVKAPNLVAGSSANTKVAHGMADAVRTNSFYTNVTVSLANYHFTQTPTVLCSIAGSSGFAWNCHVEYETKDSFTIWVQRLDKTVNWTSVPVRWIAIGN